MKSLWMLALVGLLAVGCGESADEDVEETQGQSTENATAQQQAPKLPAAADNESLEATPSADQSAFGGAESTARGVECRARNGKSSSVTRFMIEPDSGLVTAINVTMESELHSNINAVAISLRHPTEHSYTPALSSDSNLPDGKTVSVPFPSNFKVPLRGSIQVVTTFDSGWFGVTTGECRIQL